MIYSLLQDQSILDCAVSKCIVNDSEVIGCLYVSDKDCALDVVHRLQNTLVRYEIPKKYLRVEIIPRNSRGKVNRKDVSVILSENCLKGL